MAVSSSEYPSCESFGLISYGKEEHIYGKYYGFSDIACNIRNHKVHKKIIAHGPM